METLKYILDFFFSNFWHFCGLIIVLEVLLIPVEVMLIQIGYRKAKESDNVGDDNNK